MKPAAWIVVAVAAMVASVAWRFARRSKLALAIALVATTLVAAGLIFAAGSWGGCSRRGDCGPVGGTLRLILIIDTLLLPLLVLFAGARALWRRFRPERSEDERPRVRTDAARMRLRDVGLALCGGLFGLMAVVLIASGEGDDRLAGVAVLLLSIAVVLVPLSGRLAARSGIRPRLDRVEYGGSLHPALVIPGSRVKMHVMRLALLCFAGMGVLMAIRPEALASTTHSAGSVRFWGIGIALLLGAIAVPSMLLARGPLSIELLPAGLRWRVGAAPSFIAWEDITGVRPYAIRNSWFLGIDGDVQIPPRQRWLARANRGIAGADASITLEAFPVEPERLAEIVAACAEDPELRRKAGTEASLGWVADGPPAPRIEPAPIG